MAKISIILACVFTLAAAVLGYLTMTEVNVLQGTLSQTRTDLTNTKTTLGKTQADLKQTQTDLTAARGTIDDQKIQIGQVTQERDESKKKADEEAATIEENTKNITGLTAQIEDLKKAMGGPDTGGDLNAMKTQLASLNEELRAAKASADEQKALADSLNAKVRADEANLTTAKSQLRHYTDQVALHAFTGHVTAVNNGWNFVVLNVGDKQGATVNSPLVVVRNGQNIAKVRITSVEPNQSIADVVPGSMIRGQTVQPGDQVVFTGSRGGSEGQPAAGGPPTPTGGAAGGGANGTQAAR